MMMTRMDDDDDENKKEDNGQWRGRRMRTMGDEEDDG